MPQPEAILKSLAEAARCEVFENHALASECSFRLGGPARYFCSPAAPDTLRSVWLKARDLGLPVFILGGGSNVLFQDHGFPGLVISTKNMKQITALPEGWVKAQAGASNADLTAITLQQNLSGFEWASGLPGTLGGGAYMNAKCYGGAFSEIVQSVRVFTPQGAWLTLSAADCRFAYKDSIFQHENYVLTEVELRLAPGNPETIRTLTRQNLEDRQAKGQFTYPSAGCVFKNAYAINTSAGKLIEECGLKGFAMGGAKVYERHANFIINSGFATANDVAALIAHVKAQVEAKHHFRLEEEIRIV